MTDTSKDVARTIPTPFVQKTKEFIDIERDNPPFLNILPLKIIPSSKYKLFKGLSRA